MPNPQVTQFKLPKSESAQTTQMYAGMVCGGLTGFRYQAPSFTGVNGAAANDPGGLFGWLVYSKTLIPSTVTDWTTKTYFVYDGMNELFSDLNRLGGVTACLVSTPGQGGTYGFFLNTSGIISGQTFATDFLYALNYLSYGGQLVVAGTTAGLNDYDLQNVDYPINVLIGNTANSDNISWLRQKPYVMGIFPSSKDSNGQVGAGYTMQNFTSLLGSTYASYAASGTTFSTRVFNVCGVKSSGSINTGLLAASSAMPGYYLPVISDIAGFYQRALDTNTLYNSIAGVNNSTLLNGSLINGIEWTNTDTKTTLKNNRVNYFVNTGSSFLGQDLVGATSSSSDPTVANRFGPNVMRTQIEKTVSEIGLKYLFKVNNAVTRAQVVAEVQAYLTQLANFIDQTGTTVICSEANGNVDNSANLYITVVVKPIASTTNFVVDVQIAI